MSFLNFQSSKTYPIVKQYAKKARYWSILMLFLSSSNFLIAQTSDLLWAKQIGAPGISVSGVSVAVDGSGNSYTIGSFSGTIDFDPGTAVYNLTAWGATNFYIFKLDALGNFQWAKQISSALTTGINCNFISVSPSGNIYLTGNFSGTVDFDPGAGINNLVSTTTNSEVFILKLDNLGNFTWVKKFSSNGAASVSAITIDLNENILTSGTFWDPVDFDPGNNAYSLIPTSAGGDCFISKLDKEGNFLWAKQFGQGPTGGGSVVRSYSISVDLNGNVCTTGTFGGTVDFDPGSGVFELSSGSTLFIFISKLDPSGNFLWVKQIQAGHNSRSVCSAIDAIGNIIISGRFTSPTVDFDPGPDVHTLSTANGNGFTLKLDADGNFLVVVQMPTECYALALDNGRNIYANSRLLNGIYAMFKFDSNGSFQWSREINASFGAIKSISLDKNSNIFLTGGFVDTVDFDPGPDIYNMTSIGSYDIFVLKFSADPIFYIHPKIYTSKAALNVGQTQTITGKDFTTGGQVDLVIKNSVGDLIPANNINYFPNGSFSFQLPITPVMLDGDYSVYAIDNNTSQFTPAIKFKINNAVEKKLWINKPVLNAQYNIGQSIQIQWGDYISKSLAIGNSGLVQKKYKIEYSTDGGIIWQILQNSVQFNNAIPGKNNNSFRTYCNFSNVGNYKIRISDLDNVADFNTSDLFSIITPPSHGFTTKLGWDFSSPVQYESIEPRGLAADGTCRIFVKLLKDPANNKTVRSIHAEIHPVNSSFTTTTLLGKIKYATDTIAYSLQGNDPTASTVADYDATGNGNKGAYWFWLIAPDDFTQELYNFNGNERQINTDFLITYTDNSTEFVSTSNQQPIEIVRPILLLVHGLNGSEKSFENAAYNIGGEKIYFDGKEELNPLWQIVNRVHLYNYASFATNAELLLGLSNVTLKTYKSVIPNNLRDMHKRGYASNRVDYVCHSMGGDVARTMINQYPGAYNPSLNSTFPDKNYGKGFINKLITLNTPHNGSFLADLVTDRYFTSNTILSLDISKILPGFFQNGLPSPAIYDLWAYHGGIRFSKTINTKNHEIGSVVDDNNLLSETVLRLNNKLTAFIYGQLLPAYPNNNVHSYIANHYFNTEYLNKSDMIVAKSSQFPNSNQSILDLQTSRDAVSASSMLNGFDRNHIEITDDTIIGKRIMFLLNAPINSGFFSDTIAANTRIGGTIYSPPFFPDTVINYFDTNFIKIIAPSNQNIAYVDSTIQIQLNLKDTTNFQRVRLAFQYEFDDSYSNTSYQIFNIKVHSNAIGKNIVLAEATYDSAGYTINHVDTITLNVKPLDTLKGIYVYPKSQYLNRQHMFNLEYNAIFTNYIGQLRNDIDSLNFTIADDNVVQYDSANRQFVTKDTGTTHIVFNYKNFSDTVFIYINEPEVISGPLPVDLISFTGNATPSYNLLQWKASGDEFFSHFILQKSLNAQQWTQIGRVNALPGSVAYNYNFNDTSSVKEPLVYYRLMMMDKNGTSKLSNIAIIRRTNTKNIKIFPNPVVKNEVFIDMGSSISASKVGLELVDLTGKIVKSISQVQVSNPIRLDIKGVKPSTYLLKIIKEGEIQTFKIIVVD